MAPTLSAYLDDINGSVPLEAMFASLDKHRELGPEICLHFNGFLKNYFYVPLRLKTSFFEFLAEREADRVIKVVSDEAAGAVKAGAEALVAEERERVAAAGGEVAWAELGQHLGTGGRDVSFSKPGCLVSFVGVERVLGAPF